MVKAKIIWFPVARVLVPENLSLQSYLQLCYGSESLIVFNYGRVYVFYHYKFSFVPIPLHCHDFHFQDSEAVEKRGKEANPLQPRTFCSDLRRIERRNQSNVKLQL